MTVTRMSDGQWHSSNSGWMYDSKEAADYYDERIRPEHAPDNARPRSEAKKSHAESLSNDELARIVAAQSQSRISDQSMTDFVANNPAYVANQHNGTAMWHALTALGKISPTGMCTASEVELRKIFLDLAEQNLLQLREGEPLRRNIEAELYAMPMHELEARVKGRR